MLKLIVHADDFGLSERVNEGIIHAHREGILTSASLMANGQAFEHAVSLCRAIPTLDVGIHLTLVEERPLLDVREVRTLVGADGRFCSHATVFARQYARGKLSLAEIRSELHAQFTRLVDAGVVISHIDSHQHTHMLSGVLSIAADLAAEFGVPCVRFPRETPRLTMLRSPRDAVRVAQMMGLRALCYAGRHTPLARTDRFAGFFYGGRLTSPHLRDVLAWLPRDGTCELMCHPGFPDPATKYGHWKYDWPGELQALTDPAIADHLRNEHIERISYLDLSASRSGSGPRNGRPVINHA